MMLRVFPRAFTLPGPGARFLMVGDSISDHTFKSLGAAAQRQGKIADALRQAFGWTLLNANKVVNPGFETAIGTDLVGASGVTLTRDNTHAGAQGTSWAAKATSNGTATGIASLEGDVGALRMGMRAAETYTFAADYWVPTTLAGTATLFIIDRVGAGSYLNTSTNLTKANAWQRFSVTRALQAGATEALVRPLQLSAPANGDAVWIDNMVLECNGGATTILDLTNTTRAGVSNRLLQTTDNDGVGNALNLLGTNVLANTVLTYAPLDVLLFFLGVNDWGYSITTAASTASTKSRTTWANALRDAFASLRATLPQTTIIVCGLHNQAVWGADATAATAWGAAGTITKGKIWSDMNAITQQACRDYGMVYADLSSITGGTNLDDGTHPTLAGSDAMVARIRAAFGQ